MGLHIESIGTALPSHSIPQPALAATAATRCADDASQGRLLERLYARTTVERRGSVIPTNGRPIDGFAAFYPEPTAEAPHGPDVDTRMAAYAEHALPLAADAVAAALDDAGRSPADVTDLVTVTCTGFAAPGVDLRLIDRLGLPPTVSRTLVGFMGCHGAVNGLRTLDGLLAARPDGLAVLCCVELCTLHMQYGWDRRRVVCEALFADGAAAVVASRRPARDREPAPRLLATASIVLPDSAEAMTWRIGRRGFVMSLSPEVPAVIARHLRGWLEPWLAGHGVGLGDVAGWAVHPGGPRVISAALEALGVDDAHGRTSRAVLAGHGNMSSPTVLFIVQRLRSAGVRGPCVALAFGPGLVAEAALLELS